MKQYCRYCANCTFGDCIYCNELNKCLTEEQAKRTNKCKSFEFNEIDVFDMNKKYDPIKKKSKNINQEKLF